MRFLLPFLLLGSVQTEDPPVVQAKDPSVVQAKDSPVVQAEDPPVVQAEDPPVVLAEGPPVVLAEGPPVVQAEDPPVVQAEDPPVVQAEDLPVVQAEDYPVVQTPLGRVRGRWLSSRAGRRYMAFSRIPFAKPPTGQLRFQAPVPPDPWSGIREATEEDPTCIQFFGSPFGVEDCLYLSVFTHNVTKKAPVMVSIHGGAFFFGTGKMVKETYFMDNDVVIVSINYRLGMFGFLTFETEDLPGNQGLKDQVMALQWVQQSIASFGGDPERVTIHGFSAGAVSVYHHYVSPLSKGLFHRGYAMSGTSYNLGSITPPGMARSNAEKLMKLLGCPTEPQAAIPCVLEKGALEIVEKLPHFWVLDMYPLVNFGPVLEEPGPGSFLVGPASEWEHSTAPLILSMSSAEGLYIALGLMSKLKEISETFEEIGPIIFNWDFASDREEVTNKVREYYFPGKTEITKEDFVNLAKLSGDCCLYNGIIKGANMAKGDVYFLYVDYNPKEAIPPGAEEFFEIGAQHCGEEALLWEMVEFPMELKVLLKIEKDVKLSEELVKSVVHFMETGTAKVPSSGQEWKTWTAENNNYLHLHENGYTLRNGLPNERLKFWDIVSYKYLYPRYNYIQHSEL